MGKGNHSDEVKQDAVAPVTGRGHADGRLSDLGGA